MKPGMKAVRRYHHRSRSPVVKQVLAAMIRDIPFNSTTLCYSYTWTSETVSEILRLIPTFFFTPTRSIGRQSNPTRHRTPLKQRHLKLESTQKLHRGDPTLIDYGVIKSTQFFSWVESHHFGFTHDENTVKEMALVLAKANKLTNLWDFLRDINKRQDNHLITTMSITCLMKCLCEEGFVNEAVHAFHRMKQFHCKPDVYAYNTIILGLCRVGFFNKAKHFLQQMELPGFRCPPDTFTYTIMISSYCKHALSTGCRKAIRRRVWEANHLFRLMLFKGFVPDVVTYNSLIDGCCKTNRIERAVELFEDMMKRGCCLPNRVTYDSMIRYYSVVNEVDEGIKMLRRMQEMGHGSPTTSSYTPIVHGLCQVGRVTEAWDLVVEMVGRGFIPRENTYKLVLDALRCNGKADLMDEKTRRRIEEGIMFRYKERKKDKPFMNRRNCALVIEDNYMI